MFAAQIVAGLVWYISLGVAIVVMTLLLVRFVVEKLGINPFSRVAYNLTRPAGVLLANMRNSRFYYPLRRALKFDPAYLMVILATAIVCYVISIGINYLLSVVSGAGRSLIAFGDGQVFTGLRLMVGTLLLAVIFYLLVLMLLVFVNWIFGLFTRAAHRALNRIGPLLNVFEFGGVFAGWSFLLLWIALSFAAAAVERIFLT